MQNTIKYLFMITLGIQTLTGLLFGLTALLNFPFALETGFNVPYNDDLAILGILIGLALLFIGSISLLSIILIRKGNIAGVITGLAVGVYVFLFGIVAYLALGQTDALIIDGLRGAITIMLGLHTYKHFEKSA